MTEENVVDYAELTRDQNSPITTTNLQETQGICPASEEIISKPAGVMNPEGI